MTTLCSPPIVKIEYVGLDKADEDEPAAPAEEPEADEEPEVEKKSERPERPADGERPEMPEGMSFKSLSLSSPTWGAQENASLDAVIYAWNSDYDTTIAGTELGTFRKENHVDNMEVEMDFGVILPPGKYVIYMTATDDTIGAWNGNYDEVGYDAIFYFDDMENESWFPASWITLINGTDKAIEIATPAPTEVPTEKPTATPTEAPQPTEDSPKSIF